MVRHGIRLVRTLLFTQEAGTIGGVIEMGADFDPNTGGGAGLRTLYGSLGRGGYEGIHPDDWGNIWIVEDVGGTLVLNNGKNPNSFVYRFVPYISGRPDSWQIAGASSLHQRQPGRIRASGRPAPERRHTVGESTAAPHGGRVLAGPMGHGS